MSHQRHQGASHTLTALRTGTRCEYGVCNLTARFMLSDGLRQIACCGDDLATCVDQANADTVRPYPLIVMQIMPQPSRSYPHRDLTFAR
jgi:hypothetical protein